MLFVILSFSYVITEKLNKMKKENKNVVKVASIATAGALVIGALIGGAVMYNEPVDIPSLLNQSFLEGVNSVDTDSIFNDGVLSVEPVVINNTVIETEIVEVEVEVLIDNGNLDLVLSEIYDNDGSVEYLVDDLDDDELDLIVERIAFVNEIKTLAVSEVKSELFDELDNEVYTFNGTDVKFDEDDMERLRINDELDELVVDVDDFEDGDAEVLVSGTFEQDDVKYKYEATIEFKDGSVDDFDIESVTEY